MTGAALELEALERRGWEALSGADGAAFYAELMADDGLMVFPDMVLNRHETLRAIAEAPAWSALDLTNLRVIEAAPNCALVIYRATAHRDGHSYRALMSTVYARRDGRWRLLLHQQTPDAKRD